MFKAQMEVVDVKPRKLRNGNKLQIVLEVPYSTELHIDATGILYQFADVIIKEVQLPLDIEEPEEETG